MPLYDRRSPRGERPASRPAAMRAWLTPSNVMAGLALFVALGGSAVAAVTLPRNSVGALQIRADGVRSSEISRNAVRARGIADDAVLAPEIASGAVGSSELENGGIALADIAEDTRVALRGAVGPAGPAGPPGSTAVRFAKEARTPVRDCSTLDVTACANLVSVRVLPGSWLVQAHFRMTGRFGQAARCALVRGLPGDVAPQTQLDIDDGLNDFEVGSVAEDVANVTLMDVASIDAATTIGVRCNEIDGDVTVSAVRLSALQLASAAGS